MAPRHHHLVPPLPPSPVASTALLPIDQRPLQRQTWAEFHRAQKLQDKAARDLYRHEETDTPAYGRWLHAAFPTLVTTARELHARIDSLSREVETVEAMSAFTGRSCKKLWRERQDYLADPEAFARKAAADEAKAKARSARHPFFDDDFEDYPAGADDHRENASRSSHRSPSPDAVGASRPATDTTARDLYRRLVQRLHPDRGGEWTPVRERLWHEVQQAWAARDTDWLARLDIEWETAHEVINESSPISRLRQAIQELHAARRDTERKLRTYRQTPIWRFTLSEKKRPVLHRRTEADLRHDIAALQRQLSYLEKTIAAWETPTPSRQTTRPSRRTTP